MSAGTVTRADLAEAVYREIGLSRKASQVMRERVDSSLSNK